jgi:hypothetical protein
VAGPRPIGTLGGEPIYTDQPTTSADNRMNDATHQKFTKATQLPHRLVYPPPRCFLAKSAELYEKKRVGFCNSAKKRKRVRKSVKEKGLGI